MPPLTEEHKRKMAEGRARRRQEQQAAKAKDFKQEFNEIFKGLVPDPPAPPPQGNGNGNDGLTWVSPSGETIHLSEAPPWAQYVIGKGRDATDARQFVKVPDNWRLRWRSPKSLDTVGQLGWMPVTASTPGVTPLVRSMVAPDNTIRRGYNGDILHFMPETWWQNRMAEKQAAAERLSGKAITQQQQFIEDANRGKFGRYIRGGMNATDKGKFPVATGFDARSGEHPT